MKWEYLRVHGSIENDDLNKLGSSEWELVSMMRSPIERYIIIWVFKRPIKED